MKDTPASSNDINCFKIAAITALKMVGVKVEQGEQVVSNPIDNTTEYRRGWSRIDLVENHFLSIPLQNFKTVHRINMIEQSESQIIHMKALILICIQLLVTEIGEVVINIASMMKKSKYYGDCKIVNNRMDEFCDKGKKINSFVDGDPLYIMRGTVYDIIWWSLFDGTQGVARESINVKANKAFASHMRKKLLVLDLNVLFVHIYLHVCLTIMIQRLSQVKFMIDCFLCLSLWWCGVIFKNLEIETLRTFFIHYETMAEWVCLMYF